MKKVIFILFAIFLTNISSSQITNYKILDENTQKTVLLDDFTEVCLNEPSDTLKIKGGIWKLEKVCTCSGEGTTKVYREYKLWGLISTNNYRTERD